MQIYQTDIKSSPNATLSMCACPAFTAIGVSRGEDIQKALEAMWARIKDRPSYHGALVLAQGVEFPKHLKGWLGGKITLHSIDSTDIKQGVLDCVKAVLDKRDAGYEPDEPIVKIRIPFQSLFS